MLMIEYVSGLALAFVIAQLWLMGSKRYRIGWWSAIIACVLWSGFSIETGAWALLAQQVVILGLSFRALKKLNEPEENPGLSRRNVVESDNDEPLYDPITGEIYDDLL